MNEHFHIKQKLYLLTTQCPLSLPHLNAITRPHSISTKFNKDKPTSKYIRYNVNGSVNLVIFLIFSKQLLGPTYTLINLEGILHDISYIITTHFTYHFLTLGLIISINVLMDERKIPTMNVQR